MGIPISSLPLADALTGAEQYPIVQNGATKRTILNASGVAYDPAGTGAVATTVQSKLRSSIVSLHDFLPNGYVLDGSVDYTTQTQAALNHLATSAASKLEFPQGFTLRLTGPVTMRAVGKTIDGTGVNVILASSTAGFQIAGDRNRTIGFRFTQSSQSFTPTAIYIYNDATTTQSNYNRVIGVTGYSVYRGIHVYMGNTSGSCYRHVLYDCEFENFYLQKTWSGSFGIAFDGPGAGNAGGNDSRCVNCYCKGYEYDYIVNNSIATSFVNCSGDGAAYCFKYAGTSSGLRIIGGYYEYNDYLIRVTDGDKYDAYLLYPSVSNTVNTQLTGNAITYLSGDWGVGIGGSAPATFNGPFKSAGTAEIYAVNGLGIYSGNTKTLRASVDNAGTWTLNGQLNANGTLAINEVKGYTGGATPLRVWNTSTAAGSKLVFGSSATDRVEIVQSGNMRPTTDNSISLGESSNRWTVVYAATGTINTSDERAKQDIASLDDAEKRVAADLKALVKKFRFKDAVAAKGDAARIHVGVIAQEVMAVFQAAGLDANRYGILCYDEWADEFEDVMELTLITDENGDDRMEPQPTGEKRLVRSAGNRYGVRYEELLAFIIAAL